jgi:hypothetical protein
MNDEERKAYIRDILKRTPSRNRDQSIGKSIERLTDQEYIKMMSNLRIEEDFEFADDYTTARDYDIDWLKEECDDRLMLRCSVDALRSRQLENIAAEARKAATQQGFWSRLMGRFKKPERGIEAIE